MNRNLLFVLLLLPVTLNAQLTAKPAGSAGPVGFYEFLPAGYAPSGPYKYPLIINMHGQTEKGNGQEPELSRALGSGLGKIVKEGATMSFDVRGQRHAFVVLFPQMSTIYDDWEPFYVDSMINYAIRNLNIDSNKIFLTGWSLGGGGAWNYTSNSLAQARRIAGIFPIAPAPTYTNLCNIAQGQVAVWAHHSYDDTGINYRYTDSAVDVINACRPAPVITALKNIYPSGGHGGALNRALDTLNIVQYPNMFQWMIGTSRLNTAANNQAPVPLAGNDTTIIAPRNSAILNGLASYDPNDIIVRYLWTKIDGPSSFVIERPTFPITNLSDLNAGRYTFRLTVTDEFGITRSDDVNVNVTVDATLPVEFTYLLGKNSGKTNVLSWGTSSEVNVAFFEIQRGRDGFQFEAIGKAAPGKKDYLYHDHTMPEGVHYYRIRQVDNDGKFKYSAIVTVKGGSRLFSMSSYPNPVKDNLHINVAGEIYGSIEIQVYDLHGRLLIRKVYQKQQPAWKGYVDVSHLPKGMYSIQLKAINGLMEKTTFVKQ